VATDATPPEIRQLFGYRRTLAIGAAFGVITVRGGRSAGQVEVATFRRDASYSDGRHPDSVSYSTAEEDASRRDFTINGLFFDPLSDEVIDYVGGQEDLNSRLVRAIGDPVERFSEDKLRLVRAVRFAATFGFAIEEETRRAIGRMADQVTVVSAERIAAELRRLLTHHQRVRGVRLLIETGLAGAILPEIVARAESEQVQMERNLTVLGALDEPGFPLAMAVLLRERVGTAGALEVGRRWRLSNDEMNRICWLVDHHKALFDARRKPWSAIQKLVVADGAEDLVKLTEAAARAGEAVPGDSDWCRSLVAKPREQLDPPPLITGHELILHGLKPGPQFGPILEKVRDAQLDGEVETQAEAMSLVDRLLGKG
jgi:tRNA nucleotidyltransferase/poly(A) polymerase